MKRTMLAALILAGSAVPAAFALAGPAEAAACTGTSGVTVVVQFPDHTEVACAPGDPSSGFDALDRAGFDATRVVKFPGALCRIDGVPDASADPCQNMPPASAFWKYFHAKPGGSWVASTDGADGYNPKPGSVEGWRFGSGAEPETPPPGGSTATSPPPKPSATPKPAPSISRGPTTPTSQVAAPGGGVASGSATPAGTTTAAPSGSATATPTSGATPVPTDGMTGLTSAGGQVSREAESAAGRSGGGVSWVWGIGLLAVLGAIGGTVTIRRRG